MANFIIVLVGITEKDSTRLDRIDKAIIVLGLTYDRVGSSGTSGR